MKVFIVQYDSECTECNGLYTIGVCTTLEKCKDVCIQDLIHDNKNNSKFNINNCKVGDLEKIEFGWELSIIEKNEWIPNYYENSVTRYFIKEMELL